MLTALLEAPRADGAFLLRVVMSPPWGIEVRDRAPLTVVAVLTGQALVTSPAGGRSESPAAADAVLTAPAAPPATVGVVREEVHAGEVALLPGPRPTASPTPRVRRPP